MRRAPAAIVLGCALLLGCATPARADSVEQAFDAACQAYGEGKWDQAAEGFRGLLRYKLADARLEYNLANAEYKRGRLGEAILHYERARRLAPADPDVLGNLAIARGRIRDVVEDPDASGPLAVWRAFQDRIGVGSQALLTLLGVWIVAGLVTWCGARPGGFTPVRVWALAAAIAATLLAGLSWQATWSRLEGTPRAVILEPSVEALAGPGLNNAALFTLHEGTAVEVRGERGGWLQVALPNGLTGWVERDAAERI